MAAQWNVRRAMRRDLDAICRIEGACAEAPHWSGSVWMQVLDGTDESEPARVGFVAENSNEVTGFAIVSCVCGIANLESVAVKPEARRNGIGRALCETAMAWSLAEAARSIELEVRASSMGALALYGSLGFKEQGRRCGYYRDPTDDAVLMSAPVR